MKIALPAFCRLFSLPPPSCFAFPSCQWALNENVPCPMNVVVKKGRFSAILFPLRTIQGHEGHSAAFLCPVCVCESMFGLLPLLFPALGVTKTNLPTAKEKERERKAGLDQREYFSNVPRSSWRNQIITSCIQGQSHNHCR